MAQPPAWKLGVVAAALTYFEREGKPATADAVAALIGWQPAAVEETLSALRGITDNPRARAPQQIAVTAPLLCSECAKPITGSATLLLPRTRRGKQRAVCLLCSLCEPVTWRGRQKSIIEDAWGIVRRRCACGRPLRIVGHHRHRQVTVCSPECLPLLRRVKHETIPCAVCGGMFTQTRSDAQTCSNRCRQAAFRAVRRRGR
jgi:hypothetical protein